ncbi:MarR family transcriptional regulator [Actinacidiphila glaucinigra]|uniref:MarR family transcriptional regulator n=1 Tax=Actinacidiphila glaucinigra TaxID=235986 RepID=UPI002E324AA2|nr:MarR family transcriptional regulator [Actinacidiphila glaucinigra]
MTDREPVDATRQPPPVLYELALLQGELPARHRLSLYDCLILGALAGAEGRAVPVVRLTAFLREPATRMSSQLRGLEAAGLIERHRRDRDHRRVEVTLTDAGRAAFADAERTARELLRAHLAP